MTPSTETGLKIDSDSTKAMTDENLDGSNAYFNIR
jgi:hypothetical protein